MREIINNLVKFTTFGLAVALLSSCSPQSTRINSFEGHVTITPDDKHIAFDFYKNEAVLIYTANIDGTGIKQLTSPVSEYQRSPEYAPDGSKILFLSFPKNADKPCSQLSIMNSDGSDLRKLTTPKDHITEAIFAPDGRTIYFIKSAFFGHYSPIVQSHPHGFDIYAIDVDGTNERRLTNFDEYDMDGLSVTPDGKTLLFCKTVPYDKNRPVEDNAVRTLHFLSLGEQKEIIRLDPKGAFHSGMIFSSRLSPDGKTIIFSAPASNSKSGFQYELYLLDRETQKVMQLTSLYSNASGVCFFHNQAKILFSQYVNWPVHPARLQLMQINLDGLDVRKINLEISDKE